MRSLRTLGVLLSFAGGAALQAQQTGVLRGRVADAASREPVADARVTIEGTSLAAATRANGEYLFPAVSAGRHTVTTRRVGYALVRQEVDVAAGETATLDFALRAAAVDLDAVVVTGVGAPTEKRTLGNTIEVIGGDAIADAPGARSIDQALQGRVTGAWISQNSGQPGGGVSVRLRGTNSILGGGDPLWVVDGVIVDNSADALVSISANASTAARRDVGGAALSNRLGDLAPDDIERIEVLKGAAAAALYGSRANSGVIQIFTKRGRSGATRATLRLEAGASATPKRYDLLMLPRASVADSTAGLAARPGDPVTRYDIQDSIFQTGMSASATLTLSGGSGGTTYFLSGSRVAEDGIVRPASYDRTSVRGRFTHDLNPRLRLDASANVVQTHREQVVEGEQTPGVLTSVIFTPTAWRPFYSNALGAYPYNPIQGYNPLNVIHTFEAPEDVTRFVGGVEATFRPRDDVTVRYLLGLDDYRTEAKYLEPSRARNAASVGLIQNPVRLSRQVNQDLTATLVAPISGSLGTSTTFGFRYARVQTDEVRPGATNLPPLQETVDGASQQATQILTEFRTLGGFIEERVNFGDRFHLNAGVNVEASSAFGPDERWQLFPRLSASFPLHDAESFRGSSLGRRISTLRLRAAYGETGGQPPGLYGRFANFVNISFSGKPGLVPSTQRANESVRPERQREIEGGVDLGLFQDRALLELTYYHKRTFDLVLPVPLLPSSGFANQLQNVGELTNKGWEAALSTVNVNRPSFGWRTTLSLSANRNRVNKLATASDTLLFGYLNIVTEGQPIGVFYGGVYVRDASGNIVYRDTTISGVAYQQMPLRARDTVIAAGGVTTTPFAQRIIGDPNPDLIASLLNTFEIGGKLQVSVLLDGRFGNDVANFTRRITEFFGADKVLEREITRDTFPFTFARNPTGRIQVYEEYIEDGSFVKLREVAVRYRFDRPWVRKLGAETMDVTLAGRNLLTWTDYRGLDPEVNLFAFNTVARGVDFANTPLPRSFRLGVTFTF